MKRAIVLSGGGAKGAYQIGVWRALRKLEINYDIVTGTSIGAINGLMMVQKEFWKTYFLWSNITFDSLYDTPFPKKHDTLGELVGVYKKYASQFIKNGGAKTDKMALFIDRIFNEKKFYRSKINYGLVTFNLSTLKPVMMTKEKLKGKNIRDYALASGTCYPALKKTDIDNEKYIDGGYYDNMPINLAIDLGATEIIAVDLKAPGITKKCKADIDITYIKPRNKIGSVLVFDKILARKALKYGYNDTMKVYKQLDGNKYTFKKNHLEKNYLALNNKFLDTCEKFLASKKSIGVFKVPIFNKVINHISKSEGMKVLNDNLEYLGKVYEIDDTMIYGINRYNRILKTKLMDSESISLEYINKKIKCKDFKELFNSKAIIKYIYNLMSDYSNQKELLRLAYIFPKEFIASLYLFVIN
ncbi:MAG: patatin-like phospholipase family protein [Ignavibacteriales bacterium]